MPKLKLDIQRFAGEDGTVIIGVDLDTKSFDAEIEATERKLNDMIADYEEMSKKEGFNEQSNEAIELRENIQKLSNKLNDLKDKQDEIDRQGFSQMKESIENVGNSITKTIKKVIKWGLAIFSVRSAYMLVRQVASSLANTNEQIGTDIQYIRYALASALQPIIEKIIDLVYKLLAYVNYISMAWFRVNLFANATTKSFQSANKGAKELKKTLAGFDEMNILNKDGSVNASGTVPSFDLSKLENIEIPDWVDTIARNKDVILGFFGELVTILATAKIASFVLHLTGITTALQAMSGVALFGMLGGILITIGGIYQTVQSLLKWIADPTWDNFIDVIMGIEVAVAGLTVAMIAFNATNPVGWIILAVDAMALLITALIGWGDESDETTEKIKSTKQATEDLIDAQNRLAEQTSTYTSAVKKVEKTHKDLITVEKKNKMSGKDLYNQFQLGVLRYENMTAAQREVFDAYVANIEAEGKLKDATDKLKEANDNVAQSAGDVTLATYNEEQAFDEYFQSLIDGYGKSEEGTRAFYTQLEAMLDGVDRETREKIVKALPENIRKGINNSTLELLEFPAIVSSTFATIDNEAKTTFGTDIPDEVEKGLNSIKIKNALSKFSNSINQAMNIIGFKSFNIDLTKGMVSKNAKGAIVYPSMLPKLAVGGIINQPGRGVPLGGAIGGERGAEGVIPLTDSQQMELLGEAIGRYITVNLTNVTKLDSRQIARKVDKVQQNNSFIFNR